ncbi:hypothetical protein KR222_002636, partial [Zaprionus bogoriensis]
PTCRMPEVDKPKFFKRPSPCKSDEDLQGDRSLGVYVRCTPPFNPKCMDICYRIPRLDRELYRPSKSLDREYKKYWVDCFIEHIPKHSGCTRSMPKIDRRKTPELRCPPRMKFKCPKTFQPMECRPLTPGKPIIQDVECIKRTLCECPYPRKVTKCKIWPKIQATAPRNRTRYPSFSECVQSRVNEEPETECHKRISLCEAWRVFRARHNI